MVSWSQRHDHNHGAANASQSDDLLLGQNPEGIPGGEYGPWRLVAHDMSRRKNGPGLDRQPLEAIRALADANASLCDFIALAANRTAIRADWDPRPQNPLRMEEGCSFIMKVRLRSADDMFATVMPPE
jgi:hypothetical protein